MFFNIFRNPSSSISFENPEYIDKLMLPSHGANRDTFWKFCSISLVFAEVHICNLPPQLPPMKGFLHTNKQNSRLTP